MCLVVKETRGVVSLAIDTCLEMQMLCCSTACTTRQRNDVTSLYPITYLYQILGVMAIIGLQTITMQYTYQVAIACILGREDHFTIESRTNLIVGLGLQVYTRVTSTSTASIRADDLGSRQGIAPPLVR